ncbi:hypothetical protein Tco_1200744 [Tanacetum coccineum]
MLLAQALESRFVLDEEHMAFLVDNGDTIIIGQTSQELTTTTIFQTDDPDTFDSDCDEAPSTSAILMAKLSAYDSDVLLEIPTLDIYQNNNVINQGAQEIQYSEQTPFSTDSDIDITSDSNVISYEQYLKETENTGCSRYYLYCTTRCIDNVFKKHDAWYVTDTEETLKLVEESNLKMHAKQNDPVAKEKKVNITPIDYGALNRLFEHFAKHFVPQKQLSAEQDFWLPISKPVYENPPVQPEPIHKDIC